MRKQFLFLLLALISGVTACNNSPKFTIRGTVDGQKEGTMYLMRGFTDDTLAQAEIVDGKFTMTGQTDRLSDAHLMLKGTRDEVLRILLENADYTVYFSLTDPTATKAEGTETQNLYARYDAIGRKVQQENMEYKSKYVAARQANDTAGMAKYSKLNEDLVNDMMAREDRFVEAHPDSYVAAYVLHRNMPMYTLVELEKRYNALGETAKSSDWGKEILERIQRLAAVQVGQKAPDFTQNTPEGKPLSLYALPGKVKLLDFWASWCGPCRAENPNVVKMYEKYHPQGLEILSISLDRTKDAWVKAIADDGLTWKHVSDLKGWDNEVARLYLVGAVPHLILLDENNVIVAKDLRGKELEVKIRELLQ